MITVGIDAGVELVKAVVLKDGEILGKATGTTGGADRAACIASVYEAALRDVGVDRGDIAGAAATGKGKFDTGIDKRLSEQTAAAKGARWLRPEASCVVSVGADETMAAVLGDGDKLLEYAFNMKCTAGLGLMLTFAAKRLGLTLEELGALRDPKEVVLNEGCAVFAELDALGWLNRGAAPESIGAALVKAAAVRVSAVVNDLTSPALDCVVLAGGLTQNAAFVEALREVSGLDFIVPPDAQYVSALGAALHAAALAGGQ